MRRINGNGRLRRMHDMDLRDFYFRMKLKTDPIIDDTTLRDGIQMPGLAGRSCKDS
ncbi:hypothetical protein KEJ28_04305 [Candidatus Bathyarchaeota archaeon]|nr:hypothetical protein [Candidatus Bathyarchaeota archaeon]